VPIDTWLFSLEKTWKRALKALSFLPARFGLDFPGMELRQVVQRGGRHSSFFSFFPFRFENFSYLRSSLERENSQISSLFFSSFFFANNAPPSFFLLLLPRDHENMDTAHKRKRCHTRPKEQLEKFVAWLMAKNFDRRGGFLPHLKIVMGNPELASYSRNHFRTQPREGYKVEIF